MSTVLALADLIVHGALLAVLVTAIAFAAVLIHEQASLIRKSLTKENQQS